MHTKINLRASRLGRIIARLAGEEKGAVMMEYVVLAVLLVAGVVAAVMAFGGKLINQFYAAGQATSGETAAAANTVNTGKTNYKKDMGDAVTKGKAIRGGEFEVSSPAK